MEWLKITETRTDPETGEEVVTVTKFDLLSAFKEIEALREQVQELKRWREEITGDHK
jgi:hypothetical protein